jgi:hypothetical protein
VTLSINDPDSFPALSVVGADLAAYERVQDEQIFKNGCDADSFQNV